MGHEVQFFGMEHAGRIVGNHAESYTSDMDFHTNGIQKILYPFKIVYSREAKKKISEVLMDFDPEIVHLNNFNFQLTPSVLYAIREYEQQKKKKIRVVYTAHDSQLVCPNHLMQIYGSGERCDRCIKGSPFECYKHRCIHGSGMKSLLGSFEGWLYRKLQTYRLIDVIICPSRFLKSKLDENFVLREHTIWIQNFVDIAVTSIEKDQKDLRLQNANYVLYFGRYSEEKGIGTLLKVCQKLSDISFIFAGNGPLESEVNQLPNVQNVGFQTGEALGTLIRKARFSVFPSECYENCPFSVMESLFVGTPVLGSDIGGVPELIHDGINGKLFKCGDADDLQKKLFDLWNDEKQIKVFHDKCSEIHFATLREYCDKLTEIYLGGNGSYDTTNAGNDIR